MKFKQILTIIITLIILLTSTFWVNAASYTVVFNHNYPSPQGAVKYICPLPLIQPGDKYPLVNSKWDQPRNVSANSSNPHNGVDLQADDNTIVRAPYWGWVTHIAGAGGTDIEFLVDANKNGVKDDGDYRIRFYHLKSRKAEGYYNQGIEIGRSGDKGSTGSFHLHFGNYNATGAKWGKNENNYRHLTSFQWNTGMDLDAYNRPDWKNNVASLNIYVMNNEKSPNNTLPYNKMSYDEVKFFYRVVGNSAWKIATPSKSGDVYSYNVAQDSTTHGKDVQWMFRLKCNITSIYAFAPAYYYQPYADPNSTSNGYMFWTNKVVMPKTFTGNVSLDYALPFYIRNVNSGKYMTAVSVTSGGGDLVQKTFTGNTSQQFKLTSKGSGYYTITPMNATSLRVDVCNMNPANYSNVGLFTDNTAYYPGAQFFKFVSATTLYSYKIAPKCSLENNDTSLRNQVLEIAAASTADGADIRMWDYNYPGTKLNKEWLLQRY